MERNGSSGCPQRGWMQFPRHHSALQQSRISELSSDHTEQVSKPTPVARFQISGRDRGQAIRQMD